MDPKTEKQFSQYLGWLEDLIQIPSVSFPGFDPANVEKSAQRVAERCKEVGFPHVEVLTLPGAHPYVLAEWQVSESLPTVLLYAHHDVQPPGRTEVWTSEPFTPVKKEGPGGLRLYARGAADDKAGVMIHLAAIDHYRQANGAPPVNVKLIIEGEEEIGSTHLAQFLEKYRERLQADVMILTDTVNFDCGLPALTVALRGLIDIEIEVRALKATLHSGMWGGPVPDPAQALCAMLGKLVDKDGHIAVPGVLEQVKPVTQAEKLRFQEIPFDAETFKKQAGMVPSAKLISHPDLNAYAQTFRWPSLTVNAIQASSRAQAGNIINDAAWAKVTVRLCEGMDPDLTRKQVHEFLRANLPLGLELELKGDRGSPAWSIDPVGPAFEAASVAMEKGYGVKPLMIGGGGSIPFVKPFAEALGGVPALLIGVEDPYTNAHGENESMLISDFYKSCLSEIYLFEEIKRRFS